MANKVKFTNELLISVLKNSISINSMLPKLGYKNVHCGNWGTVKKKILELGLDTSHLLGKRHLLGTIGKNKKKRKTQDLLSYGSLINTYSLKNRLFDEHIKEKKCEICGITEWNGHPAPLELDHKDSDNRNNELINLQVLCANCHSLETKKRTSKPKKK